MDQNLELIITKAVRTENWEDQERANDDVTVLMAEFEKRLPGQPARSAADSQSAKNSD